MVHDAVDGHGFSLHIFSLPLCSTLIFMPLHYTKFGFYKAFIRHVYSNIVEMPGQTTTGERSKLPSILENDPPMGAHQIQTCFSAAKLRRINPNTEMRLTTLQLCTCEF